MQLQLPPSPTAEAEVVRLPRAARAWRLAVAGVVLTLTLAGTAWGTDDDFPFGPFLMYAGRAGNDAPVGSTRVVGVTADGTEVGMSGGEVGLRRAEFEGQLGRVIEQPALLGALGEAYVRRNPSAEPLVRVDVVQRDFELRDGVQTGAFTDRVVVSSPVEAAE
ncbi:hypothetical protein O2W14_12670 [Modestobacter sp. VKM Ac-2986]|uniref:hypothetical protein n=1 Tax=Modestobacter sp. VKM Ac-2986 TaxID=3004140 RepID=UPI0022ABB5CC|nr:hypothetical protein [Modestobacter sp. VKM Ac-2986]MCZ2829688.1 hypothetical protein [Modestobacter sp. VKM Ac-2986]